MAFALSPTLFAWIGVTGLVLFAAAWLAVAVLAIVRRPAWPVRPENPNRRSWALLVFAAVIAVIAVLFRLHNVNFLPWVGDMGAYVNWANEFARTGVLSATWPPLLSSFLAVPAAVFGTSETTASLGVAGLVLIVALCRILGLLGANRWIVLLSAGLAALSVHAIWYSTFPSSEALDAPMFLAWLITVVGALRARNVIPWLAMNAAAMLALGLTRGTGPFLLVPLVLLAVVVLVVPAWRWQAKRVWQLLASGLAGSVLAFWYGITRIQQYYVDMQFRSLVPAGIADFFEYKLRAFTPNFLTATVLVLSVVIVALVAWRIKAVEEDVPAKTGKLPSILGWILSGLLFFGITGAAIVNAGGWQILERIGLEFTILGLAAIVFASLRRFDTRQTAFVLLVGAIAAMFTGLQTYRLSDHSAHAFFLYWDRYFVSEVLPCLFVLTGISLNALFILAKSRGWLRPAILSIPAVVAVVAVVLAGFAFTERHDLKLEATDSYLDGAQQFQAKLDASIPNKKVPVLWTSTSTSVLPGFFFPNTWMAFARPMQVSYGYNVKRIDNRNNIDRDEVVGYTVLEQELACSSTGSILVFELQNTGKNLGSRIVDPNLTITRLASDRGRLSLLSEPPTNGGWQYLSLTVDVWKVTATSSGTLPTCSPAAANAHPS
ncbi:MAG: hypothetical protein JWQ47_2468 [Glaciihabitans sp.]|nr:hypothetical protein [Glaciihabitans sp.]